MFYSSFLFYIMIFYRGDIEFLFSKSVSVTFFFYIRKIRYFNPSIMYSKLTVLFNMVIKALGNLYNQNIKQRSQIPPGE